MFQDKEKKKTTEKQLSVWSRSIHVALTHAEAAALDVRPATVREQPHYWKHWFYEENQKLALFLVQGRFSWGISGPLTHP